MSFIVDRDGLSNAKQAATKGNKQRGFASMHETNTFLEALAKQSPKVAREIFSHMDTDNNKTVSKDELCQWVIKSGVFPSLNPGDARLTSNRIFSDIDTDRSGYLDFDEFCRFLELIRREQQILEYASKHRLTQLPASVRVTNTKQFSLQQLESVLHEKIQQLTSRDSDRYRQILTLFKHQVQRSQGKADASTLHMTSRDFNTFLAMLGLFATREQADMLFNKYDANGDGELSVHEFLTRAKAPDYPGLRVGEPFDARQGRGKKQFNNTARYGIPVKASTPAAAIYDMGTERIYTCIRERLEQTARTGSVLSDFKARRKLFRVFEVKDPSRSGRISIEDFREMLKTSVGVVMGGQHIRALCAKYADSDAMIDYPKLVMEVYPSKAEAPLTSLYRSPDPPSDAAPGGPAGKTGRPPRWNEPSRNSVHLTGSYWKLPTTRQGEKAPLPPLSRAGSTGGMGLEIRGRTPMA